MINNEMKLDKKTLELGFVDIRKLLFRYSVPSVISMIVIALYNIVDRVYIGHGIGAMAISALSLSLPITTMIAAVGTLVGMGASSRISIVLGKGDLAWARNILCHFPILTFVISAVFITFAMLFLNDILYMFGASENTLDYAREYLIIVIPASIFTNMCFGFSNILRSSGFPFKAMFAIVVGVILNIILDPIFIFWLDMGISGAAVATAISMFVGAWFSVIHFVNKKHAVSFHWESFKIKKSIIKNIISIGFSPFLMNLIASGVVMIINIQLAKFGGDLAIGSFGIVNSYILVIVLLIMGICQGMQPIVGYNYGALKLKRVKDTMFLTIRVTTAIALLFSICAELFPDVLTMLFTKDTELLSISKNAFRIVFSTMIFIGLPITTSYFFLSIGRPMKSIILSMTRQLLFLVPLIFILPIYFGLNGVWYSMIISDALSFFVALIFVVGEMARIYNNKRKYMYTPYNIWKYMKIR